MSVHAGQPMIRRLERAVASPWLFASAALLILAAGTGFAYALKPEPYSDWLAYWLAAGDIRAYTRGGLGLWLLALPKAFGLPAFAAALVLNLPSAAGMLWMARRFDPTRGKWFAWLVALYLLLITPYFGIVQLDLFAATLIGAGFCLALSASGHGIRAWPLPLAVACVAIGVSTRTQYALVLVSMLAALAILAILLRPRHRSSIVALIAVLLAGAVAGFALDSGLRALGGNSEAVRTGTAVTLYTGLLSSGDGPGCGYWSAEASLAARADLDKPLHQAALDRLAEKPPGHWLSVVSCKLPQIVRPSPYALYWLVESPDVRRRLDAHPRSDRLDARYASAVRFEKKAYGALIGLIYAGILVVAINLCRRRAPLPGLLAVTWILAFCAVHAVFEIQGRYFLGMMLLAPLLCALALRVARDEGPAGGATTSG